MEEDVILKRTGVPLFVGCSCRWREVVMEGSITFHHLLLYSSNCLLEGSTQIQQIHSSNPVVLYADMPQSIADKPKLSIDRYFSYFSVLCLVPCFNKVEQASTSGAVGFEAFLGGSGLELLARGTMMRKNHTVGSTVSINLAIVTCVVNSIESYTNSTYMSIGKD